MSYSKLIKAGILSIGLTVLVTVSSPAATVYDSNGNKVNGIEEVSSDDHKKTFKCEKGLSYLLEGVSELKGADSSKVKYEDDTIKVLDYCEFSVILESGDVYEFKCEAPTEPVVEKPAEEPKEEAKEPPVEPVVEAPPVEEPQPAEEVQQVVEAPQETQQEPVEDLVVEPDDTQVEEAPQETLPSDEPTTEETTEADTEADTEATTEEVTEAETEATTEVTTEASTEAIEESTVESEVPTAETEASTEDETESESEESIIAAPVEEQVPFEQHEINVELPTTTDTESSSVIHDVSGIHKEEPEEQPRTPIAPPVVDSDKADLSNTIIDSVQGITPEETENKEDNPYSLKKEDLILFQELEKEKEQNSVTVLVKNIDTDDLSNSAETIMTIVTSPQQDTDSVSEQIVKGIESNIEEPVDITENTKTEEKETEVTVEVPETEVVEDSFEKEETEETSEFTVVEETEAIEETEETEAIEETEEVEETEKSTEETEVAEETETEEVKESETEAVETEVIEESETEVVETEEVKETKPETQVETEVVETEPATEAVVEEPTTEVQETEPTESLLPDVKPSNDASSIITKLDIKVEETEEDAPINDEFIDKSQSDEILNVIGSHNEVDSVGYNTLDVETVKLDSEIDVEQGLAAASVINNAKLSEEKHIGYKGQTFHLNVLNGSVDNIESSNDAVASINSDGTISLNKVGKASITVESNGKTMSCEVLCANPEFDGTHIFSSTFAEHKQNARKYQRELNKRHIKK
jgi:hypothetical protein